MRKRRRRSRHRFNKIPNLQLDGQRRMAVVEQANEGGRRQDGTNFVGDFSASVLDESMSGNLPSSAHRQQNEPERFSTMTGGGPRGGGESTRPIFSSNFSARALEYDGESMAISASTTNDAPLGSSVEVDSPVKNWRVLWALLRTSGSRRFTKEQYQSVRLLAETLSCSGGTDWKNAFIGDGTGDQAKPNASYLPHYSTLYKTVKPAVFQSLAVQSFDHVEKVNLRKAGARATLNAVDGADTVRVRTILPSEYARADCATPHFFTAMYETSLEYHQKHGLECNTPRISRIDCIDVIPVVAARNWFYGMNRAIYIDECEPNVQSTYFAECGDVIRVALLTAGELKESFGRCFSSCDTTQANIFIQGKVLHVWTVRHCNRKNEVQDDEYYQSLTSRDRDIRNLFDFLEYTSPSDAVSVTIPVSSDLGGDGRVENTADEIKEAKRRRKAALEEMKRQTEQAWRNWQKPVLKPGDTVALLCPCRAVGQGQNTSGRNLLTNTDKESRVLLVSRFWVENEERSTHVLWVPGGSDLEPSRTDISDWNPEDLRNYCHPALVGSSATHVYAKRIFLVETHAGDRGTHAFCPVSSFGTLSSGQLYCIYRFVLFWDGFAVLDGKEATGEGIYMLCLNLPSHSARTSNDVRVISLTPPGVKSDTVLREITKDIVKGMTEGILDVDAEGNSRRIFLDLVGFIGDTPALNAFLDVMGHNACACCHLCRYIRQSATIVGSRYTGRPTKSTRTAYQRGFYQHQAVRDCSPGRETCRLLGLKFDCNSSNDVLHFMSAEIQKAKTSIQITSQGCPVVPCTLDPYKASFIAPDHLLTAHGRDCINLAIKLLPSRSSRELCEDIMLEMLRSCTLSVQNRILDHESKKLYGMTMTDLYAALLVAPHALMKTAVAVFEANDYPLRAKQKLEDAVSLVRSVSAIIRTLWFKPDIGRDSTDDIAMYESENGNERLFKIQALVDSHIERVKRICTMADNDALIVEESTGNSRRRAHIATERDLCNLAKNTVDKPNVHRLRELVEATLPMLGCLSKLGELPLEKKHQELKRAIRQSNKKDFHLQAIENASFEDWQGRLTMGAPLTVANNFQAFLSSFRLLYGRDSVLTTNGRLEDGHKRLVTGCLNACVLNELTSQDKYVLSKRCMAYRTKLTWSLSGPVNTTKAIGADCEAISLFKDVFGECSSNRTLSYSTSVTGSEPSGTQRVCILRGKIVEILTLQTRNIELNYPLVLQFGDANCMDGRYAPTLWQVDTFIAIEQPSGGQRVYVAVRPCALIAGDGPGHKVLYSQKLSFAELDISMRLVPTIPDYNIRASDYAEQFIPLTRKAGYPPRQG